jgi:hypothetical protein
VHPIIACIIISAAFLLHSWLVIAKQWKKKIFAIRQSTLIYISQAVGLITPLSRGPILGLACGFFIFSYTNKKYIVRILRYMTLGVAVFGFSYIYNIQDEMQNSADDPLAQSAYYRRVLWDTYWEDLMKNAYLGVGSVKLEAKNGQGSIDNAYMYFALLHGIYRPLFFIGIFLTLIIRLLFRLRQQIPLVEKQLVITFLGLLIMFIVAFGTVWVSDDMMLILFLLFGWMEGYIVAKKRPQFENLV